MANKIILKDWRKYKLWWKTICIIDWANIQKTYCEINWVNNFKESYKVLEKVLNILFGLSKLERNNIYVFVGIDPQIYGSVKFVRELENNYKDITIVSKRVKKLKLKDWTIKRKADFDSYIGCLLCKNIDNFKTFIVFSSDWDFAQIYEDILKNWKQLIIFHWYSIEEKRVWNKKKKLKKHNLWKEVYELFKKYDNILTIPVWKLI